MSIITLITLIKNIFKKPIQNQIVFDDKVLGIEYWKWYPIKNDREKEFRMTTPILQFILKQDRLYYIEEEGGSLIPVCNGFYSFELANAEAIEILERKIYFDNIARTV